MYAAPHRDRERIDGLATFAAAAFLTALGLVAALARVGAPDRVVAALGPLVAVMGLVILGLVNRTARLGDFLAARRAVPPFYGGMALAATAAGLALAFGGEAAERLRALARGGRRPCRRGADRRPAAAPRQRQRRRRRPRDVLSRPRRSASSSR